MFLLTRFEFVFILLVMCWPDASPPPSPEDSKAVQAAGKLIKDITKSFVINK
jgi:hypothetical protein